MEVVAAVVVLEALAFVIAFGATLAVGWQAVVVAGFVVVLIWVFVASVQARGEESLFGLLPSEAFTIALVVGLVFYVGWALGALVATWARSWAARRG